MEFFDKLIKVLTNNLGYTVILVICILLFAVFSNGLIPGLITAGSALIGYICAKQLYDKFPKSKKSVKRVKK